MITTAGESDHDRVLLRNGRNSIAAGICDGSPGQSRRYGASY
jgi:hypothetical protein